MARLLQGTIIIHITLDIQIVSIQVIAGRRDYASRFILPNLHFVWTLPFYKQ